MNLEQAMVVIAGAADVHLGVACADGNPTSVRLRAAIDARLLLSAVTDQQRAKWMLDTDWTRELMAGVYIDDTVTPAMTVLADTSRTPVDEAQGSIPVESELSGTPISDPDPTGEYPDGWHPKADS